MSGEVDLINDPPVQDVPRLKQSGSVKVLEGVENRVVFIGMDQQRDELLYSNVKGQNPFKDKRVRQALYQAIDIQPIRSTNMLGSRRRANDTMCIVEPVLHIANGKGDGDYNYGRYTNAKHDALVELVKTEVDIEKRRSMINEALMIQHAELLTLPLHRQVIP